MNWTVCKLQVCNLVFNKFAQAEKQKVNKHPKFDANLNTSNMTWTAHEYERGFIFIDKIFF